MHVLVTGGTGFIGSHTVVELLAAGHKVHIIDNLSNSKSSVITRLEQITGQEIPWTQGDIRDREFLDRFLTRNPSIDSVIHFAALKAVGESAQIPLAYYENNIGGTLTLCQALQAHNITNFIFSSSATVYGDPSEIPIKETTPTGQPTNPYGRTKLMVEQILTDHAAANPEWKVVLLRYFNPIGAHPSGLIGEDPKGIPNNLVPFVSQVAVGKRPALKVFGDDYPTRDGTGIRDYIHVVDLAKGHLAALEKLSELETVSIFNLGTGRGSSVFEVVKAYETISQREIKMEIEARRFGDVAELYADPSKAKTVLNWQTTLGLEEMIRDSWNWQSQKPRRLRRELTRNETTASLCSKINTEQKVVHCIEDSQTYRHAGISRGPAQVRL